MGHVSVCVYTYPCLPPPNTQHPHSNAILLCDGCDIAVHQACYGITNIPEGDWFCDGCAAGLEPMGMHCAVCPVVGGALRKVCGYVGCVGWVCVVHGCDCFGSVLNVVVVVWTCVGFLCRYIPMYSLCLCMHGNIHCMLLHF